MKTSYTIASITVAIVILIAFGGGALIYSQVNDGGMGLENSTSTPRQSGTSSFHTTNGIADNPDGTVGQASNSRLTQKEILTTLYDGEYQEGTSTSYVEWTPGSNLNFQINNWDEDDYPLATQIVAFSSMPKADGTQRMVVLTSTKPESWIEDTPGHAPGATLGGAVVVKTEDGWQITSRQPAIESMGSYGSLPKPSLVSLGPKEKHTGFLIEPGFTGQGITAGSIFLYALVDDQIKEVFSKDKAYKTNEGAVTDNSNVYSYDTEIRPVPQTNAYPTSSTSFQDIIVETKGTGGERTDDGGWRTWPVDRRVRYTFENGQYRKGDEDTGLGRASEHIYPERVRHQSNIPDSPTTTSYIPRLKNISDSSIKQRLNEHLSFDAFLQDARDGERTSFDYSVHYDRNGLLSLKTEKTTVGAYPVTSFNYYNFSLKDGSIATLSDWIRQSQTKAIMSLLNSRLDKQISRRLDKSRCGDDYNISTLQQEHNYEKQNLQFYIEKDKVRFPYDFGFPHINEACEPLQEITLSWDELQPFIDQTGILAPIAKSTSALKWSEVTYEQTDDGSYTVQAITSNGQPRQLFTVKTEPDVNKLSGNLVEINVSCGSPCTIHRYADLSAGRVSPPHQSVVAVNTARNTIAVAQEEGIDLRSMFADKNTKVVKLNLAPTAARVSAVKEAEFRDKGLYLRYLAGDDFEEKEIVVTTVYD